MNTNAQDVLQSCSDSDVIIDQYSLDKTDNISIIAGHYCLSDELQELSHEGEAEINSFVFGVELFSKLRHASSNINLFLFVNDIGITKDKRKVLVDDYVIPENYLSVLDDYGVSPDDIQIVFESKVRNRASKEIRKMKKIDAGKFEMMPSTDRRLVRCVDAAAICEMPSETKEAITIRGPDNEFLVVKEGSNPKCNTILATLFKSLSDDYNSTHLFNCFNVIYVNRINLGVHVSKSLFGNEMGIVNLFFDESGLLL